MYEYKIACIEQFVDQLKLFSKENKRFLQDKKTREAMITLLERIELMIEVLDSEYHCSEKHGGDWQMLLNDEV